MLFRSKGTKDCIDAYGVFMTEDHKVLTTEGWKSASQSKGYHRATCRLPDGYELCGGGRKEVFVGDSMRLRGRASDACYGVYETSKGRQTPQLWARPKGKTKQETTDTRNVQHPDICCVALHEGEVRNTDCASMEELRGARNNCVHRMEQIVRGVLQRHGPNLQERPTTRPDQQQCRVFEGELPVGDCQTELQQPSQKRNNRWETSVTVVRGDGDCFDDLALQAQAQLAQGTPVRQAEKNIEVYDLMDCGPRNRFVVVGNNGPVIVHNCENVIQALARIVVTYQMLEINKALARMSEERNDGKVRQVVHMVHDEVIVVVPKEEADEVKTLMERIMSTAPSWAPTLPVSCEAGLGVTYAEAK